MLTSDFITEEDIAAGKYDFAEINIFKANYADLTQGRLKLRRGWLGEVSFSGGHFVAEVRGLTQLLSQTMGQLYSASCRASLGDARCGVNISAHTVTGTVDGFTGRYTVTDAARTEDSGIFTSGVLTFTSGANDGISLEVKEHTYTVSGGGILIFALPAPYAIAAGDAYSLTKGCDKTLTTCAGQFGNVVNFRGEPHVPGLDRMLETASTRSA